MPTLILHPETSPLKRYKWALLGLVLIAGGGGVALTLLRNPGGVSADRQLAASEQSLDSLESAANSSGIQAPGNPLPPDSAGGAYAKQARDLSNPESMLYQPTSGVSVPGAPIQPQDAAALKIGKDSHNLAQALSQVAGAGKSPDKKGWGGEAPRTGFSAPRANFGGFGLGSGGGGSSASSSSRPSTFGSNSGNGGSSGPAVVGTEAAPAGGIPRVHQGTNQNLNLLREAGTIATQSMTATKADQMAGLAGRSFDATATKPSLITNAAGSSGVAGISDDAAPGNLKADDPSAADKQTPKVPTPTKVQTKQEAQEQEQEQIQMMLISAAIGGVAGPIFGGVGGSIASAAGMEAMNPGGGGLTPVGNGEYVNGQGKHFIDKPIGSN